VSSIGVGAFIHLQRETREKGGGIAIVDVHPKSWKSSDSCVWTSSSPAPIPWRKLLPH
jgi:uncharacterized UPF0146 family protein